MAGTQPKHSLLNFSCAKYFADHNFNSQMKLTYSLLHKVSKMEEKGWGEEVAKQLFMCTGLHILYMVGTEYSKCPWIS